MNGVSLCMVRSSGIDATMGRHYSTAGTCLECVGCVFLR